MTRDETKMILTVIQAAYPNYKPDNKQMTVDTWHMMLSEYSYQAVSEALKAFIASDANGFAPCIGQIIDKIHIIKNPIQDTGMEAWSMVMDAIRDGAYNYKARFDALPPMVQRAIGSAEQIHSMAVDENFNEAVARSNFLKAYAQAESRQREIDKYPADVRKLMNDTIKRLEGKQC